MSDSLSRLAKFLGMLGSDHDGEVLNAARMAEKLRKELNKSWDNLVTGKSDSRGSSFEDAIWRMRAASAESQLRATQNEMSGMRLKISMLENKLRAAEAAAAKSSSSYPPHHGSRQRATRTGSRYNTDLPPNTEADLVERLSRYSFGISADSIHFITGWERPMNLRVRLPRIAAKHGLKFEQPSRGRYRFYKE